MPQRSHARSLTSAPWLTRPETRAVMDALTRAGFGARVVGGAVRNTLLGLPVADIDIATTAEPHQTLAAAVAAGLKAIPTGLLHGTVTVIAHHVPVEVTTLRTDVETDGRHARVAFTDNWAADAARRDFTINALYCDADGTLYDPMHGLRDIAPPRIRFIGDPHARIREDYLRVLRFFRFTAAYADGALDAEGLAACVTERAGLARISAERIQTEFLKLLAAPHAVSVLSVMATHGLIADCIGVAGDIEPLARLTAIEQHLGLPPQPILRLAALVPSPLEGAQAGAHDITSAARSLANQLRLSNADKQQLIASLVPDMGHTPVPNRHLSRRALWADGTDTFRARVLLRWARTSSDTSSPAWSELYALPDHWTPPTFPLTGADLIASGLEPGPALGQWLETLQRWWLDNDFKPDRAATLAELAWRLTVARNA
jgi:poly(A) polymerase